MSLGAEEWQRRYELSEELRGEAKKISKIEHWARIGKCLEENPDLTYSLVKEILAEMEDLNQNEMPNGRLSEQNGSCECQTKRMRFLARQAEKFSAKT